MFFFFYDIKYLQRDFDGQDETKNSKSASVCVPAIITKRNILEILSITLSISILTLINHHRRWGPDFVCIIKQIKSINHKRQGIPRETLPEPFHSFSFFSPLMYGNHFSQFIINLLTISFRLTVPPQVYAIDTAKWNVHWSVRCTAEWG